MKIEIILQANLKLFTYERKKSIDVGDDNDIYEKDLAINIACKQNMSQQCDVGCCNREIQLLDGSTSNF